MVRLWFLESILAYLSKALITHSLGYPPMGMGYERFDCISSRPTEISI